MTAEEYIYLSKLDDISASIADALTNTSDMMDLAAIDPTLWFDVNWKVAVATQLTVVRIAAGDMREIIPSARIETCHSKLLISADYYDGYVDKFAEGMDNSNTATVKSAIDDLNAATSMLERAKDCLKNKIPDL